MKFTVSDQPQSEQIGEKLLLLDGMAVIFRSYYALPNLTNRSGMPTSIVFGFNKTLHRLLADQNPDLIGVAMDLPAPTFRHKEYPEYKANRPPPPPDLVSQIPFVRNLCDAYRIPILEREGFEADDVLGTVARWADDQGLRVVIVSTDKDLLQLVTDRVFVLNPVKNRLFDPQGVEDHFGVPPARVKDVLALWGDATDNIPGVPGIGEKGAKELIRRFGGMEASLRRASEVTRKSYREGLQRNAEQARLCLKLVTIRTDVPMEIDLGTLRRKEPDREKLTKLFDDFGISSLEPVRGTV